MTIQTVTINLPERLYRSVTQLAHVTQRPLADILQESLSHTVPPLDDVPPEEARELAQLSALDDAGLWRVTQTNLSAKQQEKLEQLLFDNSAGELTGARENELEELQSVYGRLLVRQSHALLLLSRRGYKVPTQTD